MPLFGNVVVIKRNGTDGIRFPLTASSCLFGRRTECDIRIQLPQVSKEHCKIEVNENKEAILTNLSIVNPTQLNGVCFQHPVPLKHGDVLTIIDRSFRFEYPLQSTPRNRCSRSPKNETLQVLHVQQVAEVELLCKQTSGSRSLHASDNAECEEKNANENKQSTEENISKALPIKLQTTKSSQRLYQSVKKQNEMSPFSKLYEKLKHEINVKNPLHEAKVSQQAAKGDGNSVLPQPRVRISSSNCVYGLGSLTKEKEIGRSENIEECKIKIQEGTISSEFNQISGVGSATKKSFTRSPRTSLSKEVSKDAGRRSHLQDHKELSTGSKSDGAKVTTKPSKENVGNSPASSLKPCSIECLDAGDMKIHSSTILLDKQPQAANMTSVSEGDKYVLSTPTPRRQSLRSHFVSPTEETSGMYPVNNTAPIIRRRVLLKLKSFSEIAAETPREDSVCGNDSFKQLPSSEEKSLKQRQSPKQDTPGKPVKEEMLKDISDQANFVNSKEGHFETPTSFSNSKSPRRSNRQSKELSNKSVPSETLASEELSSEQASPAGQKPGSGRRGSRPRTSGLLTEKALETNASQELGSKTTDRKDSGTKEELATKMCHQTEDVEDASAKRPRRLSSKRRSSGRASLKNNVAVSEINISGLSTGEESDKTKRTSQKRKTDDLLLQSLGKRKRVSFGGHLSPELFDKSLPPNSPLKRGAIPARLSLPFGHSPRAVLKKAQGLKHLAPQKGKMSPKNSPAQKSPASSSPASRKATPTLTLGSPAPYKKGRFSISHITTPSPVAGGMNTTGQNGSQRKTRKSSHLNQDDETLMARPAKLRRSTQFDLKVMPVKRRSGAAAVISAKRRSGASNANLLVAKSWAEVVKLGVARPQSKTVKKSVQKGRSLKKTTQSSKTPEKKIKGHFSTGHAESPATIVVGKAYSTTVRTAAQVPKVVRNPISKLDMKMDESFTGMTEMFQTPKTKSRKTLPSASVRKTDFTPIYVDVEMSELHTPEESGEMMVSPLNSSDASEQKQDSPRLSHILRERGPLKSMFDATSTKTPETRKTRLEENSGVASLSIMPEKQASLKSGSQRRTPKQKLESVEVMSGIKQLFRTPEQKSEPTEVLSGIGCLARTPRRKAKPVKVLSGSKQLMRTPQQKPEEDEVLSDIKGLFTTPQEKPEEDEALSDIKGLFTTPQEKPEEDEVLSDIKGLFTTPQEKPEEDEVLSDIRELFTTPQEELEPVRDGTAFKRLLKIPVQKMEAVKDVVGVTLIKKTPKPKYQPVEDMSGVSRIFKTPKEKVKPIEDVFGISRLVKTPREKYEPVDDFVGLQRLMAEPKEKCSDIEEDYVGVQEMFDIPEETQVRSVNVTDSKQDAAPPCTYSSHKYEDKGAISQGEDSQQKESTSEDQSTRRPTRGRSRKTVLPASAKQYEKNLKELQGLENKSTQEEMGGISNSTSGAKNKGRGRRTNRCIQEENVSKHPDQEKVETVSFVEPCGATQRLGRGKRKEMNLESCGKDSSVLQKEPVNVKQALQEYGINDLSEAEGDPTIKTVRVSSRIQYSQLQASVKTPENKPNEGGVEDSEEMLLPPAKRSRGVKKVENTEPLFSPKRGRRARNDQIKQTRSKDLHGTTRKLRKDPSVKMIQREERTFDKDPETPAAEESEREIKTTEKRVRSLRSARNRATEVKGDISGVALENTQNIQKTEETSTETRTETQSHIENEIKISQGDETENAQGNTTEASQNLKAESPSGKTNKIPVTALNLEARSAIQETNRTRSRRGKNYSLKEKSDEFEDLNNLEIISPKFKSETEMDESSLKDSLSSVCVKNTYQVMKDQNDPAGTSLPATNSGSLAQSRQKRTGNGQGILKPQQTEILQENRALNSRRGRGRKINFKLEEASSKAVGDKKSLPEDDKGMTYQDGQHETSENPSSQVKGSRGKRVDSMLQIACSTFMEKQTLVADHSKNEAPVKKQDSTLEATPSTEDKPPRRGKRREVAAASQTSQSLSTGKRRRLLEGDDKNVTVREDQSTDEDQNMPLETVSCVKKKPLGRGRRKENALTSHTTRNISLRGKCSLPADSGSEQQQSMCMKTAPSAKENPSRAGRKKRTPSKSEETSSTSLRAKPGLPKDRVQKRILKEGEDTSLENNSSQEKTWQLRNKRKKVEVTSKAATSISNCENGKASKTRNVRLTPTGSEKNQQSGKGKEVNPIQRATSASLRRKCLLPADDLASKKVKSENDENRSLQKGKRKKTEEQRGEEDVRVAQAAGGTDRKTRSSTRTSARTRK